MDSPPLEDPPAGRTAAVLRLESKKMPEEPVESFEAGLAELESIVKQLEGGELPLEKSLELFEKGMQLSERCRKQLEAAETRIETLTRRGDRVTAEPFKTGK